MNEDAYLDSYWEDRYELDYPDRYDPASEDRWDDEDDYDEDHSDADDFVREDFGWFGEAGLWD